MRFRQLSQNVFDTKPFFEAFHTGVNADVRGIRVLRTDHLFAGGVNDPLCYEIRNVEVGEKERRHTQHLYSEQHEKNWSVICALLQKSKSVKLADPVGGGEGVRRRWRCRFGCRSTSRTWRRGTT